MDCFKQRLMLPLVAALLFLSITPITNAAKVVAATQPATQPAAPAWISKALTAWPPILLTNRVMSPDNGVGFSGSSGFVRLPNGVVVLMTAGHLLGDVKPADFAKGFKSWIAVTKPGASGGVRMKSIAMDTTQTSALDILVLLPTSQQSTWPATVLPARTEPLEVGETVYLVGIPEDKTSRQIVRKGQITKRRDDNEIEYAVEGTFKTTGNSGAPVVDSMGRLAAVNVGHLNDQTMPGKMQLSCIETAVILPVVKIPPEVKAVGKYSGR